MLQTPDFLGNNIHTGWLDSRIAAQVTPPAPLVFNQGDPRPITSQFRPHFTHRLLAHAIDDS